MKKIGLTNLLLLATCVIFLSSCTYRLVDFTVISTKNAEIGVDRSKGKNTEGKKSYIFGFGWNLKDAIDNALENAGKEYDLLVDGVVTYNSYPFLLVIKVKGLAVSSTSLKAELGEDGYKEWLMANNVVDPKNLEEDKIVVEKE